MAQFVPTEYNPADFKATGVGFRKPGLYLRPAVIREVHTDKGLVDIEWLDYPGRRTEVLIPMGGQGIYSMPTVGATVLVGFGQGFNPYIIQYIPVAFETLMSEGELVDSLRKGEQLIVSYNSDVMTDTGETVPTTTGSVFYMQHNGDILMSTITGSEWLMSKENSLISQESMNYTATTEAGVLDFGLIKRGDTFISPNFPNPHIDEDAFTEFRLRILETADGDPNTLPEVDDPFIELVLGTKVAETGTGDNKTYKVAETNGTHAVANKEIMIQLKTKADQGFEFTVDKEGNVTVKVKGDIKVAVDGDSTVSVGGNATLSADVASIEAKDVQIGSTGSKKAIVLADFISKFNSHMHTATGPTAPTTAPNVPVISKSVTTSITKVE